MRLNQTSTVNPFSKKDKFTDITRQSIKEIYQCKTEPIHMIKLQITNFWILLLMKSLN